MGDCDIGHAVEIREESYDIIEVNDKPVLFNSDIDHIVTDADTSNLLSDNGDGAPCIDEAPAIVVSLDYEPLATSPPQATAQDEEGLETSHVVMIHDAEVNASQTECEATDNSPEYHDIQEIVHTECEHAEADQVMSEQMDFRAVQESESEVCEDGAREVSEEMGDDGTDDIGFVTVRNYPDEGDEEVENDVTAGELAGTNTDEVKHAEKEEETSHVDDNKHDEIVNIPLPSGLNEEQRNKVTNETKVNKNYHEKPEWTKKKVDMTKLDEIDRKPEKGGGGGATTEKPDWTQRKISGSFTDPETAKQGHQSTATPEWIASARKNSESAMQKLVALETKKPNQKGGTGEHPMWAEKANKNTKAMLKEMGQLEGKKTPSNNNEHKIDFRAVLRNRQTNGEMAAGKDEETGHHDG